MYVFSLGKVKDSGSISQIYSSLWKPWSYLTGSTPVSDLTTQETVTSPGIRRHQQICHSIT